MQTVIREADSEEDKSIEGHTVWMCRKILLGINATVDVQLSVLAMVHGSRRGD